MFNFIFSGIFQKAFVAVILTGIMLSEIGTLLVLEQFTFAAAGITHVAFAGVTFFLLLGIWPLWGAFLFSFISALALWYFTEKEGVSLDASMGVLFAFFMGLAVLFMGLSTGYTGQAISYLFGSVLTVELLDIYILALTFILVQMFFLFFHKDIFLVLLNRELAEASGVRVKRVRLVFILLIAFVITISMKIIGALLILGMAVMPSIAVLKIKKSFLPNIVFSGLLGGLLGGVGLFAAIELNTPPSATIIVIAFLVMIGVIFAKK